MKNIKEILSHLPLPFDKLEQQRCLKYIISSLPTMYKNNIKYSYIKGETLYFITKHQAINFELYQKLNNIKLILKIIHKKNKCLSINITNIKAWTEYTKTKKSKKDNPYKYYIKEKNGNFKNLSKNKDIYEAFEEIREIIKNKNK